MSKPHWYIQPRSDETDAAWRTWQSLLTLLTLLAAVVEQAGGEAWIVGGALRDTFGLAYVPGPPPRRPMPIRAIVRRDVDVAVSGDPLLLARAFAADLQSKSGDYQGAAIAPLRAKTVRVYIGPPILPFQAQLDLSRLEGATIEADLARRDFRVNAMALPLAIFLPTRPPSPAPQAPDTPADPAISAAPDAPPSPDAQSGADDANTHNTAISRPSTPAASQRADSALSHFARLFSISPMVLIDPFGGLGDIEMRRLNVVGPHALTDDPGRILRAARLHVTTGFALSEETTRLAREAAPLLLTLPADRVRDEMRAIMAQERAHASLACLVEVGAFQTLLPALWMWLSDAPPDEAFGEAWALALSAMGWASSLSVFGVHVNAETRRPIGAEAQLLDGWYGEPLGDGAPRGVALRWGLLLAAPIWRNLALASPGPGMSAQPADMPTSSDPETAPTSRAGRLAEVARTLPITREERRIAETIALAIPEGYALLALLAWREDVAAPGATGDDEPPLGVAAGDDALLDAIETRRFFAAYGVVGVDALTATLGLVRALAQRTEEVAPTVGGVTLDAPTIARMATCALRLSAVYLTTSERIVPPPLVDGATIIRELGAAPGPLVGETLAAIRAAQIERRVASQEDALAWGARSLRERQERMRSDERTPDETT